MKKISFLLFIIMLVLIGCAKANDPLQENHKMNITHIYPTSGYPLQVFASSSMLFVADELAGYHVYDRNTNQLIYSANEYLYAGVPSPLQVKYIAYHEASKTLVLVNKLLDNANWQVEFYNYTDPTHPVYIDMASGDTFDIPNLQLINSADPDSADFFLYRAVRKNKIIVSSYVKLNQTPPMNEIDRASSNFVPQQFYVDDNNVYGTFGQMGVVVYNKDNFNILSEFDTPGTALDIKVKDNYAYVADKYAGLQVYRFDSSMNATLIKTVDTDGYAENVDYKNNYLAVSSTSGGVYLFDISNPENTQLVDRLPLSKVGYLTNVHFSKSGNDNTLYLVSRDKGVLKVEID